MVAFTVVGSVLLARLNQGRFDDREREKKQLQLAAEKQKQDEERQRERGVKKFNLEEEYEKMMREIDIEKWEAKRIPRKN